MFRYIITCHTGAGKRMLALNAPNIHKAVEEIRQSYADASTFIVRTKKWIDDTEVSSVQTNQPATQ